MSSNKFLPIIVFVGILCLCVGLYSVFIQKPSPSTSNPSNNIASSQIITLQGNDSSWHSVGNGNFTLDVTGGIDYGGGNMSGPNGSLKIGDTTALVPGVPFGAVVARIGSGKPFMVGSSHTFNSSEEVSIAINDSYYEDNNGSYTITKK